MTTLDYMHILTIHSCSTFKHFIHLTSTANVESHNMYVFGVWPEAQVPRGNFTPKGHCQVLKQELSWCKATVLTTP